MANLTAEQIAKVVQESIFSSRQWAQAGREFAQGMKSGQGFSSQNQTGTAGGRGQTSDKTYRDAEKTLSSEIKLRKLANAANEKTTKMMNAFADAVKVVHPRMKTFRDDISLISNTLDKHFEQISDSFDTAAKEIKFWEKQAKKTGISLKDLQRNLNKINKQLDDSSIQGEERYKLETELVELEKKRAALLDKSAASIERSAKMMAAASTAMAAIGAGAVVVGRQIMGDIATQRRFGTPGGMLQQQAAAYGSLRGVDPELMSEQFARSRRAVISMGGHKDMEAFMEQIGSLQRELTDIAGDPTAAFKFQMDMYEQLVNAGIKPTEQALRNTLPQFKAFQESMGMTTDEYVELQKRLNQNATIQLTMMGLDKKDRELKRRSIEGLIQFNRNLGMSAEQAEAAAMALQELGAKGPRERFKKVAQLQALAASTGIQMSEEARQGFLRGRSATEEQQKAMQQFQDQMGTSLADISATMGGTGTELAVFSMMDKLGMSMEDFRPHISALGQDISNLGPNFNDEFVTMIEGMTGFEKALNGLTTRIQEITGMLQSAAGGGAISSMASSALGAFVGARGLGWLRGGAGSMIRGAGGMLRGAGGLLGAAPGAIGALGGGATVGSAGLATSAGAVGAAGVAGYGVGTLINNLPRWFGEIIGEDFDNVSTNIIDGFERLFVGSGEEQRAAEQRRFEQDLKDRAAQRDLQVKQLLEQERTNEIGEISLQLQQGMISNTQARDRIMELNMRTQTQFLVGQ